MVIQINIDCSDLDLHEDIVGELTRILGTVPGKIEEQLDRSGRCVCTALESVDTLRNLNGNVVGTLEVIR